MKNNTKIRPDKNFLIYPAFADPTQPYVALPTLKAYLKQHECPVQVQDWNIEGIDFLFRRMKLIVKKHKQKTQVLQSKKNRKLREDLQLLKLQESSYEPQGKWKNLRKNKSFFNWQSYQESRLEAEQLLEMISALAYPYEFGFNKASPLLSPWDPDALEFYIEKNFSPLNLFYQKKIKDLLKNKIGYIGISLTFVSQLPETFYICSLIKKLCPDTFIVLGGAALHQLVSNMPKEDRTYFFKYADALCTYEGEETFKTLHTLLPKYKKNKDIEILKKIPNLLVLDKGACFQTKIHQFKIETSMPPDYSDLDLSLYFSPKPTLLYAPTRGCYWNKCSFCYYGFSQSQTHHYREKNPKQAAKELISLAKKYNVQNFYISGDVLSPRFAVELAKELIKKKSKINWSTDLRIEKYYTPERCKILYHGGLRAVAFGIESGSNKMLCEIINKGTSKELITQVNANFYDAGIATAWMTFLYHPREKMKDAITTLEWIREEQERISLFIIGEFGLTPGSRIYGEAQKFNIKNISYAQGDFFKIYPMFEETTKNSSALYKEELEREIQDLSSAFHLCHYPWAGAISTHHSLLYLTYYGQDFFRKAPPYSINTIPAPQEHLKIKIDKKLQSYLASALRPKKGKIPLSFKFLQKFLEEN